jgi:hypothetical protein
MGSGMLHSRYRDYRTMRQRGREMSDPTDLRASQWLTQICGLGSRWLVGCRGLSGRSYSRWTTARAIGSSGEQS